MKRLPDVRAWVVTVDMGYGHQRAAQPLGRIAQEGIVLANNYPGMPEADRKIFHDLEGFYTAMSRFKKVPLLGPMVFSIYDRFQKVPPFDPRRDMSRPTVQVRGIANLVRRRNWGRHLIDSLGGRGELPFLSTFFSPAHMADLHGYPGGIYCVICDADFSRDWVARDPKRSRIFYFTPTPRAGERLRLYGVPEERILLTGFPLPEENLGYPDFAVLREDTAARLVNLDPDRRLLGPERARALESLEVPELPPSAGRPLTLMFAVGGAGAQAEIGLQATVALASRIRAGEVQLHLIAGVSAKVRDIFRQGLQSLGLEDLVGRGLEILFEPDKPRYFESFNRTLRRTDILWTKPSELVFYAGLGVPLLLAPTIGSQEEFNRDWLVGLGAGIDQGDMKRFDTWFFDALHSGGFARAALNGYLKAPRQGTHNIINFLAEHQP
jgi:hypothetical protein